MSEMGRTVRRMASTAERTASTMKTHRQVAPSPSATPITMGVTAIPMAKNKQDHHRPMRPHLDVRAHPHPGQAVEEHAAETHEEVGGEHRPESSGQRGGSGQAHGLQPGGADQRPLDRHPGEEEVERENAHAACPRRRPAEMRPACASGMPSSLVMGSRTGPKVMTTTPTMKVVAYREGYEVETALVWVSRRASV